LPVLGNPVIRTLSVVCWLLLWLLLLLVYAWVVLFTAFVFAYFGSAINAAVDLFPARPFGYWIWIAGAVVGLVSVPADIILEKKKFPLPPWNPARLDATVLSAIGYLRSNLPPWNNRKAMTGAVAGAFIGLCLGGLLAISWFSIATSPFAPVSWKKSLYSTPAARKHTGIRRHRESGGISTKHPMPIILFLGTPAVLAPLGFAIGGFFPKDI